jgi:hypothetical protein
MGSTVTGASILARGVRKFAATSMEFEDVPGFHVVEDNNDEWVLFPEIENDWKRLAPRDQTTIRGHLRWW